MRILQICPYYPPYPGGQERHVEKLSRELVRLGHSVTVLTSDYCQTGTNNKPGYPQLRLVPCLLRIMRNPITPSSLFLASYLRQFDVLHLHNEHTFQSLAAFLSSKGNQIPPYVLTHHGELRYGIPVLDTLEHIYEKTLGASVFKNAAFVIALTESDKTRIEHETRRGVRVVRVPSGIDPSEIPTVSESEMMAICRRYNIEPNKRIILFVGPVLRRKGIEVFLEALKLLDTHGNEDYAVVVGDGADLDVVQRYLDRFSSLRLVMTGRIAENELAAWFKLSTVFVLPSFSEGLPKTILEANFHGTPVLCSDLPTLRSEFEGRVSFFRVGDPFDLASRLQELLDSDAMRGDLGAHGREGLERYQWRPIAYSISQLYESAIGRT